MNEHNHRNHTNHFRSHNVLHSWLFVFLLFALLALLQIPTQVHGQGGTDGCSKYFLTKTDHLQQNGNDPPLSITEIVLEGNVATGDKWCLGYTDNSANVVVIKIDFIVVHKRFNLEFWEIGHGINGQMLHINDDYDKKTFSCHCPWSSSDASRSCSSINLNPGPTCKEVGNSTDFGTYTYDCGICDTMMSRQKPKGCPIASGETDCWKVDHLTTESRHIFVADGRGDKILLGVMQSWLNGVAQDNQTLTPSGAWATVPLGFTGIGIMEAIFDHLEIPKMKVFYGGDRMKNKAQREDISNMFVIPEEIDGTETGDISKIFPFVGHPMRFKPEEFIAYQESNFNFTQAHSPARIVRLPQEFVNPKTLERREFSIENYVEGATIIAEDGVSDVMIGRKTSASIMVNLQFPSSILVNPTNLADMPPTLSLSFAECTWRSELFDNSLCDLTVVSNKEATVTVTGNLTEIGRYRVVTGINKLMVSISGNDFYNDKTDICVMGQWGSTIPVCLTAHSKFDNTFNPGQANQTTLPDGDDGSEKADPRFPWWGWFLIALAILAVLMFILFFVLREKLFEAVSGYKKTMEKKKKLNMAKKKKKEKELEKELQLLEEDDPEMSPTMSTGKSYSGVGIEKRY